MLTTDDLAVERVDGDRLTAAAGVDPAVARYLDAADVVDWSGRSRYHRLGAETQLDAVRIGAERVAAELTAVQHGRHTVTYSDGDRIGRVYGYNADEAAAGDALTALVEGQPMEQVDTELAAVDLQPGFYRPTVPDDVARDGNAVAAAALDAVALDDLLARGSWARMLETDLVFRYTEPVTVPATHYAVIVGTEHPDERHLSSTVIDPGYGGDGPRPVAVEVKSARQRLDGRWPRPLVRYCAVTEQ